MKNPKRKNFLNCFSLFTNVNNFQAQADAQIDTLTSEQASSLVAHLNLGPIYTILQGREQGPLSSIPGMDPLSVKEFTVFNFRRYIGEKKNKKNEILNENVKISPNYILCRTNWRPF